MFFGLPDDALSLRDGLREVLSSACSPAVIRTAWKGDPCEPLWKTLGDFGLPGLLRGRRVEEFAFAQGRGPDPRTIDNVKGGFLLQDDPLR